jgi:Inner membrane component of T3SS, cytoplasmic domain
MGRAPNPGAPQRVSAHVVPKVPSAVTSYDEDEKTTIESGGWEEEASTTVEQGEVADKVRALGIGLEPVARPNTGITSTGGQSMPDEPTVDEQRGNAALALLPPPALARLAITQGNDAGQVIEVRPGKTYTIGRAIDNDLVLTDVTVSRKHFDLRHDHGAWVLADRGSGNGTLVNTRLEDAPFALANGDVIEIGNTTFRFELPSGAPRGRRTDHDDDLELSTMSGQPIRDPEVPTQLGQQPLRPKTLPPPAPLSRPRSPTNRPSYALERASPAPLPMPGVLAPPAPAMAPTHGLQGLLSQPAPATTLPLPQMANRPPLHPSALLDRGGPGPGHHPGHGSGHHGPTLPGPGPQPRSHPARLPFSYPSSTDIPTLAPRGTSRAMAVVSAAPARDASSTALVPPMSYSTGQGAVAPVQAYTPAPQLTRRAKMALAGTGIALFAAIATIAIIEGASGGAHGQLPAANHAIPATPTARPVVEPIAMPVDPAAPAANPVPAVPTANAVPATAAPTASSVPTTAAPTANAVAPATTPSVNPPPPTQPPSVAQQPAPLAQAVPPPSAQAQAQVQAALPTVSPAQPTAPPAPPSPVPPAQAARAAATAPPSAVAPPTTEPARPRPTVVAPPRPERVEVAPAPRNRPAKRVERKPDRRPAPPKVDTARIEIDRTPAATPASVATRKAGGRSIRDVKNEADALYRAKNFSGAAALVSQSLPSFAGGDAQELKSIAAVYSQLGKAYNVGMGPGTKQTDAYINLRRALEYDRDVGSAYVAEIQERLVVAAARAAVQYMAAKEYGAAFQAVRVSEQYGSSSPSNKTVRDKLESLAADLVRTASSELASNPEEARRLARQVQGMVDAKNPLHARATKMLSGS